MGGQIADRVRAAHARRLREEETAIRGTTTGTSNFGSDVDLRSFLLSEAAKARAESAENTVDLLEIIDGYLQPDVSESYQGIPIKLNPDDFETTSPGRFGAEAQIFDIQNNNPGNGIPTEEGEIVLRRHSVVLRTDDPNYIRNIMTFFDRVGKAGTLVHERTATIYGAGLEIRDGGVLPFMVMEKIDGPTIDKYIHPDTPIETALDLTDQTLDILASVHNQGIIHRDVKPSNLVVDNNGEAEVHLTDFGLAREISDRTYTGTFDVGTPTYAAPEQINEGKASPKADVYSTGLILAELILGKPIERAGRGETYKNVSRGTLEETLVHNKKVERTVALQIADVVMHLVDSESDDRYDAQQALAEVRRCKDLLNGNVAEGTQIQIEKVSGYRSEWDVPEMEVVGHIRTTITNGGRDSEILAELVRYGKEQPCSERDKRILEITRQKIERLGEHQETILGYLDEFAKTNPEEIFGMDREQLRDLYMLAVGDKPVQAFWSPKAVREHDKLREVVEMAADAGLNYEQLSGVFQQLHHLGNVGIGVNKDTLKHRLERIKKGYLEEVEVMTDRYARNDFLSKRLMDQRFVALFSLFEGYICHPVRSLADHEKHVNATDEDYFLLEVPEMSEYLVKSTTHRFVHDQWLDEHAKTMEGVASMGGGLVLGAGAGALFSYLTFKFGLNTEVFKDDTLTGAMFISSILGGFFGFLGGYFSSYKQGVSSVTEYLINGRSTNFAGKIYRKFSRPKVLEGVHDLLSSVDPSLYHTIPQAISDVKDQHDDSTTPYNVLATVGQDLKKE